MSILYAYQDDTMHFHHSLDARPSDTDFPMHIHEQYELFCFLSGDASYFVEGSCYPLSRGCVLLMRQTESHKVKIHSAKPYERFAVHFSPALVASIDPSGTLLTAFNDRPLGQKNFYRPSEFPNIHPKELLDLMCAAETDAESKRLSVITHLYPLLWQIRAAFLQKTDCMAQPKSIAEQLIAYINQHLFGELSLDFLSQRFFLSSSQLNRQFKQATGSTIGEYILAKRLVAARALLKEGETAGKVCRTCGFRDYSSFYRSYRKRYGVSPKKDVIERCI